MMNRKEQRLETMKNAGLDTTKFFNLQMDIPVGSKVEITIDGVPYTFNSSDDAIVKDIIDKGYVFNSRTDGRFVTAQTFKMLNEKSYNQKTKQWETGWDAYLRNYYPYMYQFSMMLDEAHRLARMERDNDPEFARLSKFFTKDVIYETCNQYIRQLKKYVNNQRNRTCKGKPYVRLNKYGDVFMTDLNIKVYNKLESWLNAIKYSNSYSALETSLKSFMNVMCKLPADTPKCPQWKTAFKGKGAYVTLLNLCKFHGVTVQNYETGERLDRDRSIAYVESLLNTYKANEYWKFHELLKATIELNNFNLNKSIETQNRD